MVKMGTVSWKSMLVVVMMLVKVMVMLATAGGNGANLKVHKTSVAFTDRLCFGHIDFFGRVHYLPGG